MYSISDRTAGVMWLGGPLLAMLMGDLLLLPSDYAIFASLWVILSLPLGIAVGHCALSETEADDPGPRE
jgi:hypothetical protein